jgi:plastocyanin
MRAQPALTRARAGLRLAAAVASALALAACGGGGDGDGSVDPPAPVAVASVVVAPAPATVAVGQTVALQATVRDADGALLTGRTVRWTTAAPTVATVDSISGVVRGLAAGQAQVTATSEGRAGTTVVNVTGGAATTRTADTLYTFPEQWSSPEVVIRVGGFVDFFIEGSNSHNALFRSSAAEPRLPGAPDDIPITSNQRVRRTFAVAGEFPVVCTVHPGMTARVVVRQ